MASTMKGIIIRNPGRPAILDKEIKEHIWMRYILASHDGKETRNIVAYEIEEGWTDNFITWLKDHWTCVTSHTLNESTSV